MTESIATAILVSSFILGAVYGFGVWFRGIADKEVKRMEFYIKALEKGELPESKMDEILNPPPLFEDEN